MAFAKGGRPQMARYARGGAVLGRTKDFMKTPDKFRTNKEDPSYGKGSSDGMAKRTGDKALTPIKPRG